MKTDMLKHIASFIAVAENKSLTMAAEQLGCSKAHLSQQIKKLEQYYQIQLFLRTTRQLTLSAVGEGFLKECQLAIKIINNAELNLLETKNLLRGEINLTSVGGVIGEQYIAPAVIQFMKMHPNIKVNLDFSSDHRDLIASRYDLAIRMGELDDSSLIARHLCWYTPTLVASPEYLKKYGCPSHPNQLVNHQTISGSISKWQFVKADPNSPKMREEYELKVDSCLTSANGHVMMAACKAGLGFSRLPSIYVKDSLESGELVAVLKPWNQSKSPCHLVYPPSKFRLQRVKALAEWIVDAMQ
ncbi:LysR family transcriptional regulator [Glaciecola sp. KUL10]|uniref:LysR family transcriptional regulator n=1 Tax=Glaciecola sp. (strain KUL10) TaxID=2161813 RepID=UPI000D78AC75|nr:LysR family transcriptional regulator [Glaciecola sp. KUL10]GBL03431.1 substrate-binding transcriptional regulator, LysR family [Glaciecola sp. KUL10]